MDPQVCWKQLCDLLRECMIYADGDMDEDVYTSVRKDIVERLNCLAVWINKGGYLPTV